MYFSWKIYVTISLSDLKLMYIESYKTMNSQAHTFKNSLFTVKQLCNVTP